MKRVNHNRQPWVYLRLSREDINDSAEPVDLKLDKRKAIALGLAAQHNQIVPDENILVEVVSGKSIEQREQFKTLLECARSGEVSFLFTPYFDRLLRGSKRDEADVEDALKDGDVVVVSTEGVFDFGDPNFDVSQGLAFTVRNAVSRQYLYDLSKKLRETNLVRTKQGQRSAGSAPYGYEWIKPVYKNKRLECPGHYETIAEEYAVICEIFRRIWTEGARSIAGDLNARFRSLGYPAPPSEKNRLGWNASTIFSIAKNPFYSGFPTHRFTKKRRSRVLLDRDDWVMPEERQSYPCPLTPDEWERLQHRISARKLVGTPKTNKQAILTGVLCCSYGRFMTNRVGYYACTCREYATKHKGMAIHEPKINKVGFDLVRQAVLALPEQLLDRRPAHAEGDPSHEYRIAIASLHEARENRDELMLRAAAHVRNFGEEAYQAACHKNRERIEELEQRLMELEAAIHAPNLVHLVPLLRVVRRVGFDTFWEAASVVERRTMLSTIVARLVIVEPTKRLIEEIVVEPQEWLDEYVALPERVRIPGRAAKK